MLGHASLEQTSTYLNATLRGMHRSMRAFDLARTIERTETELGWEFVQIYGLTETTPLITMNRTRAEFDDLSPADRAVKLNRAGAPVVGCTMAVDAEGEILARGNMVMDGYWDQPDQTDAAIHDGLQPRS